MTIHCELSDMLADCKSNRYIIITILYIILSALFILSLVFASFILNESSENPLEKEEYSDKYTYFKYSKNFGNDLVDCKKIKDSIMIQNLNLTDIFDLNSNSINSNSKALISLNVIIFFFSLFVYCQNICCGVCCVECCGCSDESGTDKTGCYGGCCDCVGTACIMLIILSCLIADAVVFGILCGKFDDDGTKNFLAFLECQNINKEAFEKYLILDYLNSHISSLKIFQSLYVVYIFIFLLISMVAKLCFINIDKKND